METERGAHRGTTDQCYQGEREPKSTAQHDVPIVLEINTEC